MFRFVIAALNELYWRLFWGKTFARHEDVDDFHTNNQVGIGFGMARSKQTLSLVWSLYSHKRAKDICALDLGCGDGAALRALQLARFPITLGIEFDAKLVQLAKLNNPRSEILQGDFTDPNFLEGFTYKSKIHFVYAFNPAPGELLCKALVTISRRNTFTLFLRNPVELETLTNHSELIAEVIKNSNNLAIIRVSAI